MKKIFRIVAAVLFAIPATAVLAGQQNVATQNSGPSLEQTMSYIHDRLSEIHLRYMIDNEEIDRNEADNKCQLATVAAAGTGKPAAPCAGPVPVWVPEHYYVTNVSANASTCSLAFHLSFGGDDVADNTSNTGDDPKVSTNLAFDYRLSLRDVRSIKVATMPELVHLPWKQSYSPAVYGVGVTMNPGKSGLGGQVEFLDEETADRFAKALNHAAQLCGSVDNDPFK